MSVLWYPVREWRQALSRLAKRGLRRYAAQSIAEARPRPETDDEGFRAAVDEHDMSALQTAARESDALAELSTLPTIDSDAFARIDTRERVERMGHIRYIEPSVRTQLTSAGRLLARIANAFMIAAAVFPADVETRRSVFSMSLWHAFAVTGRNSGLVIVRPQYGPIATTIDVYLVQVAATATDPYTPHASCARLSALTAVYYPAGHVEQDSDEFATFRPATPESIEQSDAGDSFYDILALLYDALALEQAAAQLSVDRLLNAVNEHVAMQIRELVPSSARMVHMYAQMVGTFPTPFDTHSVALRNDVITFAEEAVRTSRLRALRANEIVASNPHIQRAVVDVRRLALNSLDSDYYFLFSEILAIYWLPYMADLIVRLLRARLPAAPAPLIDITSSDEDEEEAMPVFKLPRRR